MAIMQTLGMMIGNVFDLHCNLTFATLQQKRIVAQFIVCNFVPVRLILIENLSRLVEQADWELNAIAVRHVNAEGALRCTSSQIQVG